MPITDTTTMNVILLIIMCRAASPIKYPVMLTSEMYMLWTETHVKYLPLLVKRHLLISCNYNIVTEK